MKFFMLAIMFLAFLGCEKTDNKKTPNNTKPISTVKKSLSGEGKIIDGLRVYTSEEVKTGKLSAFRGDYVKIIAENSTLFSIDSLSIIHTFPEDKSGKAYFKLKQTGEFSYKFGEVEGKITITEYSQPNYKAVSAEEGAKIIENISPLILDVRTDGEFKAGHLENAMLIPVQVIQKDYVKIEEYKEKPIFIYCASGNRSTVASRILIEKGFTNIYNLRPGISGWARAGLKIVK